MSSIKPVRRVLSLDGGGSGYHSGLVIAHIENRLRKPRELFDLLKHLHRRNRRWALASGVITRHCPRQTDGQTLREARFGNF